MSLRARLIRVFYESAHNSLRENLDSQLDILMANIDHDETEGFFAESRLLETKFSHPASGMYALIIDDKKKVLWKSLSTSRMSLPEPSFVAASEQELKRVFHKNTEYYELSFGMNWFTPDKSIPITINIITDLTPFHKQIGEYRRTLWGWLIGLAVILLLAQSAILVWGLRPMRNVINELNSIESGKQERIHGKYPQEILRLTDNINGLLESQYAQQTRYRDALADLAHSLKTPLAVLHGAANENKPEQKEVFMEQIQRMDNIVAHQLQRAATAGASPVRQSIELTKQLGKIITALGKVYQDKQIRFENHVPEKLTVRVDEGDLMELLGNVMDNACKHCQHRVRITASMNKQRVLITIADDGKGIEDDQIEHILQRGGRADESKPGQGIGLSVVLDILRAYQTELSITRSDLGGAAFAFELPCS
jgi:two-component system sensor histidine kinase PhoQ